MRSTLFFLVFKQPIALVINDRNNRWVFVDFWIIFFRITLDIPDQFSDFYPPKRRSSSADDNSAFNDLPLSDRRSLSFDPPEVDPGLFKDPQAVASSLLAKRQADGVSGGVSSKDFKSRQFYWGPCARNSRSTELMDRMITDKKQWAESIVALTHCLHRLQKLPQVQLFYLNEFRRKLMWNGFSRYFQFFFETSFIH